MIVMRGGKEEKLSTEFIAELEKIYHNVSQELSKARLWTIANPAKRPLKNPQRFILNWFNRQPSLLKPATRQAFFTPAAPRSTPAVARAAIADALRILR